MLRRSLFILLLLAGGAAAAAAPPQTPEQFLGFRVGTDRRLATWDQVTRYYQILASQTDRVRYQDLGKTTNGNSFPLVEISSARNLARREEIMRAQQRLALPYTLEEGEAEQIMRDNPAVVLITFTIHSSEIGSTQMSLELAHRLATEDSPYIRGLLDNVYLLLVPSANPDGQVLQIDWYLKNVGTPHEYASMPWLYHPYTGHDDNRDAFMLTQVESRHIARILYRDWFPVVFLDEHQMGSSGPRVFVPPFQDPINQNQEPGVIALSSLMGMHMFNALNSAGLPGAIYGEQFAWWWQGSAKNGAWWHNMVGLLSEVASARIASPVEQKKAKLYGQPARAEPGPPGDDDVLPAPTDLWPRSNYPNPWLGGVWRLRDIIDYELVFTFGLLEGCAAHRLRLQRSFYELNRKNIALGRKGSPFAAVLPADQHDPPAAARMLQSLDLAAIEIYRTASSFNAGAKSYPAGSWVIPMGQPFRNYAKDLLEAQVYPVRPPRQGEAPDRPYDVTGWTLPFQMGVKVDWVAEPFDTPMQRVSPIPHPEGEIEGERGPHYLLPREWNRSALVVNRVLAGEAGAATISWTTRSSSAAGRTWSPGAWVIESSESGFADRLAPILREAGVPARRGTLPSSAGLVELRAPRIGLYQAWTANMDEGWTRFVLDDFKFPYTTLHNKEIAEGGLREKFDVIIFPSQSRTSILRGNTSRTQRPEYRGGIGAAGESEIARFVRTGGTLIALEKAGDFAIHALELPVRDVLAGNSAGEFYSPGGILRSHIDTAHPLGYGMQDQQGVYFTGSPAYAVTGPLDGRATTVARYPDREVLMSGYLLGESHIANRAGLVEVREGKGRAVLFGFRPQFRAQPHGTFKLLFNAIYTSSAVAP